MKEEAYLSPVALSQFVSLALCRFEQVVDSLRSLEAVLYVLGL